jgi:uncharacterized protein
MRRGYPAMSALVLGIALAATQTQTMDLTAQTSRDVQLTTPAGTLRGTLLSPAAAVATRTVAVIISGSGPTDRDGNSGMLPGKNNSLLQLAEALADGGIATLRYDKIGVGESVPSQLSEVDLRFDHFIDHAAGWVLMLRDSGDYDRIFIIGHSEGALIGKRVAEQTPVAGVVSIAGMGRSLAATIRGQLAAQLPAEAMVQVDSIMAAIAEDRPAPPIPPFLASLFRPSVQPYLRSLMTIDPAAVAARLDMPLLIINGTTDLQVSVEEDARRLAAAAPSARLVTVEGMNHVLKRVDGNIPQQLPSYSDPSLPIAAEVVQAIREFMR